MIRPEVGARIEKSNEGTCTLDQGSHVTALRPIAKRTSIRQIFSFGFAAMFFTDDVVYFTTEEGVFFVYKTVLAEEICPCCHESAQGRTNVTAHQPDGHGP